MKLTKSKSPDGRPLYKLETDLNIAIPGDIHIPFHDPVALRTFVDNTSGPNTILLIPGDCFDRYALSTHPKEQKKLAHWTLQRETEAAAKWFQIFDYAYDDVIYMPGNHEDRWDRLVANNPALVGMEWWWPIRDIVPSGWELLDVDARIHLRRDGRLYNIEHGHKASRNSSYVSADKLARQYPNQTTIIGHNHKLGAHHQTHWITGKYTMASAYSVGHLANVAKLGYVSAPDWQQGGALIRSSGVQLLHVRGEKVTWL